MKKEIKIMLQDRTFITRCEGCGNNTSQCSCRKDNIKSILQVICVIIVFVICFIAIINCCDC